MSLSKVIFIVGMTSLAGFLGYKYITADPPGYCQAQGRYIPDDEFIRTVIPLVQEDINFRKPQKGDSSFYSDWDGYVPDTDDYACCRIERQDTYTAFNRMFGFQRIYVRVLPPLGKFGTVLFTFDVCGTLKDSYIGLPSSNLPAITTLPYRRAS